jgi:hypothetical protein
MALHPQIGCPFLTFYLLRCPTPADGYNGLLRQRPGKEK